MAIVSLTIVPLGVEGTSLSAYVAGIHKVLEADEAVTSGRIKETLHAMGTILEGDLDEVWALIRKLQEVPFEAGAQRAMTLINVDDRRDKKGTAKAKVASVRAILDQDK